MHGEIWAGREKEKLVLRMSCIYYDRITKSGCMYAYSETHTPPRLFRQTGLAVSLHNYLLVPVTRPGERRTTGFSVCAEDVGKQDKT